MSKPNDLKFGFETVCNQYLAMYPVSKMQITNDWNLCSVEWQNSLISCTIKNPIAMQYPSTYRYMTIFLKYVISQLEQAGVDIIDEWYESLANLLHNSLHDDNLCFKTYIFDSDEHVTLKESTNIISRGTTGLCTWQASQHLAELLLEKKEIVKDKAVLELGSGLGFLGLVLCKSCQPSRVLFSDCHSDVIDLLVTNVKLNLMEGVSSTENSSAISDGQSVDVLWSSDINSQTRISVSVLKLDWQHVTVNELQNLSHNVDVIIAADVVYDEIIIPHLVRVLSCLLDRPSSEAVSFRQRPIAIISSTVRNTETRDQFLVALASAGLVYRCLQKPLNQTFFYDRTVLIQTLEISLNELT